MRGRAGLLLAILVASCASIASAQELRDRAAIVHELTYFTGAAPGASVPSIDLAILFKVDSAELDARAARQLDELAWALAQPQLADARIGIFGHTDASGSAEHNRRLSLARAEAVRAWLVERAGIAADRLVARGFGFDRLRDRANPKSAANRRVEIVNLSPPVATTSSPAAPQVSPSPAQPPGQPAAGTQAITQ